MGTFGTVWHIMCMLPHFLVRWQQELAEELEQNKRQTKSLKKSLVSFSNHSMKHPALIIFLLKGNLKKALAMTDKPMKVNSECQQFRKSRTGQFAVTTVLSERHWSCGLTKESFENKSIARYSCKYQIQASTKWRTQWTSSLCKRWMVSKKMLQLTTITVTAEFGKS